MTSCMKQLRRRRLTRLSILWILLISVYFVFDLMFPTALPSSAPDESLMTSKAFAPFLPNESKSVVLLTYQRGGSTMFGNLFNTNPNAFYIFEPLDALYTDMYGTARGWNVPSEITNYWNGTERILPVHEIKEVSSFLRHIFQCKMSKLPTSFFVHPYYFLYLSEYRLLHGYIDCIDKIEQSLSQCSDLKPDIETFCGSRFGEQSDDRSAECYEMLWRGDYNVKSAPGKVRQSVFNYRKCIGRLRKDVDELCTPIIQNICSARQVRAVKCVRATMDSMEPLLQRLPNLRIIHLIRDARGVVLSRLKFHDSTRNRYSDSGNDTLVREAELYCRTVVKDIKTRRQLEKKYPGKIVTVTYDEFVTDIASYTEKIYRFLDLVIPNSTLDWIREASKGKNGKNATSIASAWQEALSYKESISIVKRCREFFRLVGPVSKS